MATLRDILKMDNMNQLRLLAGENGLDHLVVRAGIIDYESIQILRHENLTNEMLISNLPMIQGKSEMIKDYVQVLIEAGCACFAIKTSVFKEIPQDAIDLANTHDFPLFLFDDLYIDKMVIGIENYINNEKELLRHVELIKNIQKNAEASEKVMKYVAELNPHYYENLMVYKIRKKDLNTLNFDIELVRRLLGISTTVLPIEEDYLIIYSSQLHPIDKKTIVQKLGINEGLFTIGASTSSGNHHSLGKLINECDIALEFACYKDVFLASFEDAGIYQVLIPMLNQPVTKQFFGEIIERLKKYDDVHQSDLLKTAAAYIHSDGNIKKTAENLFQHENTIRFRIRKLKEVINYESFTGVQYETLALAIHFYELKNSV